MGAIWLAYRGLSERTTLLSLMSFLMVILSVSLFVSTKAYFLGIVLLFIFGAGNEICAAGIVTLTRTSEDDEKRGRVMGANFLIDRASNAFGMLIIGTASDCFRPVLSHDGDAGVLFCYLALAIQVSTAHTPDISWIADYFHRS